MKCQKERCYSPVACNGFGYCRELNLTEGICVVLEYELDKSDLERGWECKSVWEAKRLVQWLGENGIKAKQVTRDFFKTDKAG